MDIAETRPRALPFLLTGALRSGSKTTISPCRSASYPARLAKVRCGSILLKKSKIEWLQNSRECQLLVVSAARSLCRTSTKVTGRFCANRCGPSRRRVSDAPAGLKIFAHELAGTFSTQSARNRHSDCVAQCPLSGAKRKTSARSKYFAF
jgi:hypothetical protein